MMTRLLAAWILILAPVAAAQQPRDKLSPGLEIGGQVRSRLEMWDWFGGSPGSSYAYSGNILRLSLEKPGRSVDWKLELAAPVLLGLPDDAILPAPAGQLGLGGTYYGANGRSRNAAMIFPKQAFVRLRNLGGSDRHSLRLGRFEFIDGSETTPQNRTLAALKRSRIQQRLIGNFGFSHVGRSFDGLHYAYDAPGANFTVVAAL
ncbi:MAG: hypothetical protein FJW35_08825, partial [Acidobacteria bacterium]|nr:hypothetical protein [Acidobacteriota bacterium]